MKSPWIHIDDNYVYILGEKEGLEALGKALILKSKLLDKLSIVLKDGCNKPITIECREDLN